MKIIARITVALDPLYANHRFVMSPSEAKEEEAGEFGDGDVAGAAHSRSVEAQRHVSEILRLIKAAKQAVARKICVNNRRYDEVKYLWRSRVILLFLSPSCARQLASRVA
jgi:hypothetical protein